MYSFLKTVCGEMCDQMKQLTKFTLENHLVKYNQKSQTLLKCTRNIFVKLFQL